MSLQVTIGILLTLVGAAALGQIVPQLAEYAYPIIWWGVLLLVDAWNWRRKGLSLWRGNILHFLLVTAPASVVAWVLYEALNLPSPQWRYRGDLPGVWIKVFFGFVAFSTVVPIMVESWWLIAGRQCLPEGVLAWFRRNRGTSIALAAVVSVLPFMNHVFWFNQGIWLVPALILLPFVRTPQCPGGHFLRALFASALLAGLAWEAFNYPSITHWEYLILTSVPHLFYMPVPGYLGFVPFALSMLAVHEYTRELKPGLLLGAVLYAVSIAGLYWLTLLYMNGGIWLSA